MQTFKITCTCLLMVLISCLSVAKPVTQVEKPSQKIEQIDKKKRSFAERIIPKRIKKRLKNGEDPAKVAKIFLAFGIVALAGVFVPFVGLFSNTFALGATIMGAVGKKKYTDRNTKSNKFLRIGMILGIVTLALYFVALGITLGNLPQLLNM